MMYMLNVGIQVYKERQRYGAGERVAEIGGERRVSEMPFQLQREEIRRKRGEKLSGWRNLPFMRGGYGSRGVCRLIRVFLVRVFSFSWVPLRRTLQRWKTTWRRASQY